jgi:hypothetical protein
MVRQLAKGGAFDGLGGAAAQAHLSAQIICGRISRECVDDGIFW